MDLKQTPLYERHVALGAHLVAFGGYRMPLYYQGIQEEHLAVRRGAGLFDLSHMGEIFCRGDGAFSFLQRLTTNDLALLAPGQIQYSVMCYPDGGIVDDLLVYRLADGYMLVVNAGNVEKDWTWLNEHRPAGVQLENASDQTAMLAVQGPRAEQVVGRMTDTPLQQIPFYGSAVGRFAGRPLLFSRTGYTGEDGFEIYCPAQEAPAIWDLAIAAGGVERLVPVGLGARNSLRLEMRYALYGHEIDAGTNPIAAGLGFVCRLDKGAFIGREAIATMQREGPHVRLVCLMLGARAIPRDNYRVFQDNREVGTVRSGLFSPSLGCGIATAYVEAPCARIDTQLEVQLRDRRERAVVVKPPFYRGGSRR